MTEIDWNPLIAAGAILLVALATAVPGVLAYFSARRTEKKADLLAVKANQAKVDTEAVMAKVDGNFSDLKAEVLASKAETITANQRIAVLTERLITSTPASASPPPVAVVINGAATPTPAPVTGAKHLEEIEINTKDTADTLKGTASSLKKTASALKRKK